MPHFLPHSLAKLLIGLGIVAAALLLAVLLNWIIAQFVDDYNRN
jgi:hypothetical protein